MIVLGIETTCDETAAALVERLDDGRGRILSNIVWSQTAEHAAFGGVVPEIAARAHVEALDGIIATAMDNAAIGFRSIDAVAAAAGRSLGRGTRPAAALHAVAANAHQTGQSAPRQGAEATLLIMAGMQGRAARPARCEL